MLTKMNIAVCRLQFCHAVNVVKVLGPVMVLALAVLLPVFAAENTPVTLNIPAFRQQGPNSAPVAITVFSDFQCPSCALAEPLLREILKRYSGQVRVIFCHMPKEKHKWAYDAAGAAECAGAQEKFQAFRGLLFEHQKDWGASQDAMPFFLEYAGSLGLDVKHFQSDMASNRWRDIVDRDKKYAKSLNVSITPTFFIQSRRLVGIKQFTSFGEQYVKQAMQP